MDYKITFTENPSSEDKNILSQGIADHARLMKKQIPARSFAFFVHDKEKKIIGGCDGCIYYNCLYIDQLWLAASIRGNGLGTQLMYAAENFAQSQGAQFSTVNTMDWEALPFYQKIGYTIEFERHGYAKNSIFYFLRKNFT
jgi:GNAT superfamily N-acetyltransferase